MTTRRGLVMHLAAAALAAAVTVGCAELTATTNQPPTACDELENDEAEAAVLILADGRSPALDRFVGELSRDAEATFASPRLGLDTDPGLVLLSTYDQQGRVDTVGRFTLAGVGPERVRREANAARQAQCLEEAVENLPKAEGGHLLRALPTAIALSERLADRTVIVATGLGRATGDGFTVAQTDLGSADSRQHILDELEPAGFIPQLDNAQIDVVLLSPGEGVDSGIVAGDVTTFADDLCARANAQRCRVEEALP